MNHVIQIALDAAAKNHIWTELITRKTENQARALALLGRDGTEKNMHYAEDVSAENVDAREASPANDYFYYLHPGLNRRNDDPVNSCLNYGYAVLRNAIIRSAILVGFQLSFGLHHDNYLNVFNLADDLIKPWRPFVDIVAMKNPGTGIVRVLRLTEKQYESIWYLTSAPDQQEEIVGRNSTSLFDFAL